jgi:hypothetical protein
MLKSRVCCGFIHLLLVRFAPSFITRRGCARDAPRRRAPPAALPVRVPPRRLTHVPLRDVRSSSAAPPLCPLQGGGVHRCALKAVGLALALARRGIRSSAVTTIDCFRQSLISTVPPRSNGEVVKSSREPHSSRSERLIGAHATSSLFPFAFDHIVFLVSSGVVVPGQALAPRLRRSLAARPRSFSLRPDGRASHLLLRASGCSSRAPTFLPPRPASAPCVWLLPRPRRWTS